MKKILLVFALAAILATGTAFADHPEGFGIGAQFGGVSGWYHFGFGYDVALTLKIPSVPVFWTFNFNGFGDYVWMVVSGDMYLIDAQITGPLHWYLGPGLYVDLGLGNPFGIGVGGRLPIGLSIQPLELLEIYIQLVPSIGVHITPTPVGLGGGIGGNLGIRFWF